MTNDQSMAKSQIKTLTSLLSEADIGDPLLLVTLKLKFNVNVKLFTF